MECNTLVKETCVRKRVMWLYLNGRFPKCLEINLTGNNWVQAIDQNRDLVPFINKLKLDAFNFYNSCCMRVASFNVL